MALALVVLAAEHLLDLGGLDLGLELVEAALQIGEHVLSGVGPLDAARPGRRRDGRAPARSSASSLRRRWRCSARCASGWLFQKSGAAIRASSVASLSGVGRPVKDSSADRWPA